MYMCFALLETSKRHRTGRVRSGDSSSQTLSNLSVGSFNGLLHLKPGSVIFFYKNENKHSQLGALIQWLYIAHKAKSFLAFCFLLFGSPWLKETSLVALPRINAFLRSVWRYYARQYLWLSYPCFQEEDMQILNVKYELWFQSDEKTLAKCAADTEKPRGPSAPEKDAIMKNCGKGLRNAPL